MARKKKKTTEELFATELAVKIDSLTLDRLIEHYVHLRFYLWHSEFVTNKPYYVFENMPETIEAGEAVRKAVRFETQELADQYVRKIRESMKQQLLKSFNQELGDGNADEADQSTGRESSGSQDGPERSK